MDAVAGPGRPLHENDTRRTNIATSSTRPRREGHDTRTGAVHGLPTFRLPRSPNAAESRGEDDRVELRVDGVDGDRTTHRSEAGTEALQRPNNSGAALAVAATTWTEHAACASARTFARRRVASPS